MGTSPETIHEVRNLLKKLDHSIDAARSRRLSSDQDGEANNPDRNGQPEGDDPPIGRARPIRRTGTDDSRGGFGNGAPRSGNF